ncbi:MAG: hypothetical protein K2X35_25500 [Bryobacteraceae bacterium]|nr:hypothetical protein [Bryobacteraceae bacterium]
MTDRRSLLLSAALLLFACKRTAPPPPESPESRPVAPAPIAAAISAADPNAAVQFVNGFHGIEGNAWRWTMAKFTVALKPPDSGPGVLKLRFSIPEVISARLGPLTLSATAGDAALKPETYAKPGDYVYERELPATLAGRDSVLIAFSLDKALPPSGGERRELGVVVASAEIVPATSK